MLSSFKDHREVINTRYVQAVEYLIANHILKSRKELSEIMQESPNVFSQIKAGGRNASINQLNKIINGFDINANYLMRKEAHQEKIIFSPIINNVNSSIHHNGNTETGAGGIANSGLVYQSVFNIDRMVERAPEELKKQVNQVLDHHKATIDKNEILQNHVKQLEKTIKILNKRLDKADHTIKEKDQCLLQMQTELIKAYKANLKK